MIDQAGIWEQLAIGGFMRDHNGVMWKVMRIAPDGRIGIQNREGDRHILPPRSFDHPVTLVGPDEAAVAKILADKLGAAMIAETERGRRDGLGEKVWKCPPFPTERRKYAENDARIHLKLLHGIYVEPSRQIGELTRCHDDSHERMADKCPDQAPHAAPVPHIHRPN